MRPPHTPSPAPARNEADSALDALDANELRQLIRDLLPEMDELTGGRVTCELMERATRKGSGWTPAPVSESEVAGVLAFVKAARRSGHADPTEVDRCLRLGTAAFLGKDYATAQQIFGTLLRPFADAEIDLGQDELIDEVLSSDVNLCATQYLVATYMVTTPEQRPEALRAALHEVNGLAYIWEPIRQLESVAVEPLPDLDNFLASWQTTVAKLASGPRGNGFDRDPDRWLREVVARLQGPDGLAGIARATRSIDDLRAWCQSLINAGDWASTRSAFEEAAALLPDDAYYRADFLDGAALAAQKMGQADVDACLERAWRAAPTMLRLRRWLGTAHDRVSLLRRASAILGAPPQHAKQQQAFLHLLVGDFEEAATLLATAPGLGWSYDTHPGHLMFHLFVTLLGPTGTAVASAEQGSANDEARLGEFDSDSQDRSETALPAPDAAEIMQVAGITRVPDESTRTMVLAAMRKAAEQRLTGITSAKRRRHYDHAAHLVATCVACDRSPESIAWVAAIRQSYSRFPALRAELDAAMVVQ